MSRDGDTAHTVRTGREAGVGGHRALIWRELPERPAAAVLVLHGGEEHSLSRPGPINLPGLRMQGFVRALRRETAGAGVAIGTVRYRHRGWNGERADAGRDTRAALGDLAEELGRVPTVLVGHSMGGRAALYAAGHPNVTGVIALAPWCPAEDACEQLAGRDVLMLHGDRDRVTAPADTLAFAARSRAAGARVCGYTVVGSGHALLQRIGDWHRATARLGAGLLGLRELPAEAAAALALPAGSADALTLPLPPQPRTAVPRPAPTALPTDA
ncbi:serine aminopeptidase domain-containing protein [Kitasatospora sp. A2-31]|uniref:serine aminopeptidase domain-containing protein n=1 Tax=Kitasatospora sp. A2-31 TaxID=2916414 RepID=UPI001EEC7D5A|nr:alpha/beta hydrolase [Kitasatospora sp. A2-31]MCG6498290.1 lysophospholipase [Kitasatospora sp. A2-31]